MPDLKVHSQPFPALESCLCAVHCLQRFVDLASGDAAVVEEGTQLC